VSISEWNDNRVGDGLVIRELNLVVRRGEQKLFLEQVNQTMIITCRYVCQVVDVKPNCFFFWPLAGMEPSKHGQAYSSSRLIVCKKR